MADDEGTPHFYERPGFLGTAAVVGLVSAIWALVGAPTPWKVVGDVFSTEGVALSNTEVILDTSSAMGDPFEGEADTKLDAAVRAIGQSGERDDEGLALRRTNPSCEGEEELLVDFGTDHKGEVLSVAEEQRPEGKSNITNAVIEALGDFRTQDFGGPRSTRRVLVFTAGRDDCFEGNMAGKIKAELKGADISASFTLIALKVSGVELERLEELKNALESADAYVETRTPRTEEQLDGVVEDVKEQSRQAIEEGEERAVEEEEAGETVSG
jgi:hypothetical protein